MPDNETLVRVENVSKKYCKSLKRSFWYGMCDTARELNPFDAWARPGTPRDTVSLSAPQPLPKLRSREFWAVKNVSFELKRGECLGLIGHNGSGKSTLLKMLNGLIKPDTGRIEMRGRVGALIELGAGFKPILTGRENIYNKGAVLGLSKAEMDQCFDEIVDFSGIEEFIDMPVQNYSSGMKVRLGFAVSAFMKPDVLIIDEVLAVGDLGFIVKCLNRMSEIIPNGAIIFVSHDMPMVNRICSRAMLLDRGDVEYHGNDISSAIEQYIHRFPASAKTNQGTGEMGIVRVGLRDAPDKPYIYDGSYVHQNGNALQIELEYAVNSPSIKQFKPDLVILDQQLRPIIQCSPVGNEVIVVPRHSKTVKIEVTLPKIYPNSGMHTLTIIATDPEAAERIYCRTVNAAGFVVHASTIGWAANIIHCPWRTIQPLV